MKISDEVTEFYMKMPGYINEINSKAKIITVQLKIGVRLQQLDKRKAFIMVKDHKHNFANNLLFQLINPMRTELDIKLILQKMCDVL